MDEQVERIVGDASERQAQLSTRRVAILGIAKEIKTIGEKMQQLGMRDIGESLLSKASAIDDSIKTLNQNSKTYSADLKSSITDLTNIISGINFSPTISVKAPTVKTPDVNVDLTPLQSSIDKLGEKMQEVANKDESVDLTELIEETASVRKAINGLRFPVPNYVLPFKDSTGKAVQVQLDGSGNIPTSGGSSGGTTPPATPTVTSVGDTTTSTQLLASNTSRKEAEFYNTSSAILYILKGSGTASSTNFTIALNQGDYYTTNITSAFQGVWASDAGGIVAVTESV